MRLKDLAKYGLPEIIIAAWQKRQGDYLLPLQDRALREGLIGGDQHSDSDNLLISAPTSAGKSFCEEMAAMAALGRRQKAVIMVPLKSIAEEKYRRFCTCYREIGIKAIAVTGDHPENDHLFQTGKFDLAVAISEKFNRLLTVNLDILRQIGLVVVDELQMIGDPERGPELEMALTKIIASRYPVRLLALSAVIEDETALAQWLHCRVIREATRPVDLLQGIAVNGDFRFRSFNSGLEGKESFPVQGFRDDDLTESLLQFLKEDSRRKLIFLKSRRDTINAAFRLAAAVGWDEAKVTLGQLEHDEPGFLVRSLRQTLSRGVAFHNADLTPSQRRAVEEGYLRGEIKVLFSTTTLAMGVNLPAEMVLLETLKYSSGEFGGRPALIPISPAEFQNITGRAGRFGLGDNARPGRAVILAESEFESEILWSNYIDAGRDLAVRSALEKYQLPDIILDFAVSGLVTDIDTLTQALSDTLHFRQAPLPDSNLLMRHRDDLITLGLMGENFQITPVGRAVAETGLMVADYNLYAHLLRRRQPETLPGWLTLALCAGQFDISRAGLLLSEFRGRLYEKVWHQRFADSLTEIALFLETKTGTAPLDFRPAAILKAAFLLTDWAGETPVSQLEERYQLHHGQIIHLAETAAWLLGALGKIIGAADSGAAAPARLDEYAFRVQFGIAPEMKELHHRLGSILNRNDYRHLRQNDLKTLSDIKNTPREKLAAILDSEPRAGEIIAAIDLLYKEDNMNKAMTSPARTYRPAAVTAATMGANPAVVELDGSYQGERYLVRVNGFPLRLTGKSFKYLAKLAYARLVNQDGWIYKDDIEIGFNQARYLYRLKQEVNRDGGCPWGVFENNRLGYYRLELEPSKIRLNLNNLRSHDDYEVRRIAENLTPRLVS